MILLKNLCNKLLLKSINKLSQVNIISLYVIFLILIFISSIFFYNNFILLYPEIIDDELNIIYKNIPFEYGKVVENLIVNKKYSSIIDLQTGEVEFYLNRLPIVPFIYFLTNFFSSKLYFLIISKNIIFFSILFFVLLHFSKQNNYNFLTFLILNLIFYYNFYNLKIIYNFVYADYIIGVFLPILFIISISNFKFKYFYIGTIVLILYLSKANMFLLCIILSFYFLIFEKKKLPIFFTLIAIVGWGFFGYVKTDKFPVGPTILSTNSQALSISFNKDFHKFYPLISVDYIKNCDLAVRKKLKFCKRIPDKINNEWEYYDFYKNQNKEYFKQNKNLILKDMILKIKTIFFNFYEDGQIYEIDKSPEKNFDIFIFINKLVLITSIIVAFNYMKKKKLNISNIKTEIIFFIILFSSLPPYLLGWALNRHLVYLFLISHIYLFLRLKFKKNKIIL